MTLIQRQTEQFAKDGIAFIPKDEHNQLEKDFEKVLGVLGVHYKKQEVIVHQVHYMYTRLPK